MLTIEPNIPLPEDLSKTADQMKLGDSVVCSWIQGKALSKYLRHKGFTPVWHRTNRAARGEDPLYRVWKVAKPHPSCPHAQEEPKPPVQLFQKNPIQVQLQLAIIDNQVHVQAKLL